MTLTCDHARRCHASRRYDNADRVASFTSFTSPDSATAATYAHDQVHDGQNVVMQFQAATKKLVASPFRLPSFDFRHRGPG
jgi:hypothetical protein